MKPVISPNIHYAVIFDLDGVITKTANVHAKAWKQLFDPFLQQHAKKENIPFVPFDIGKDYAIYVDGKPRYDGIQSFFHSRGIVLPKGSPGDSPEENTVCGLANKKNQLFLKELEQSGVEFYQSTIDLIKKLRKKHIKIGLISSSKNCTMIINQLGIADLFDAKIDGVDAAAMGIRGKPAPDVFLEAAKILGVEPQHAVVVEDAISGVQAGRRGGFAEVIGVDRVNQSEDLLFNGAHVVVKDLQEVELSNNEKIAHNALQHMDAIKKACQHKQLAIFLDYDGTLTPIVSHADLAVLSGGMRQTLLRLKEKHIVSIISGRDREDVEKKVGIQGIFYAGSHGFDIAGPGGIHYEIDEGKKCLPLLEGAEHQLREDISPIEGAWVERKKFSVAIHYRQIKAERESDIKKIVDRVHQRFSKLRITHGKKVFELQPDIPWNKGKAILWLMKLYQCDEENFLPFYFGDDTTDEDGFRALMDHGIGIAVQTEPKPTAAKYRLRNPSEVQQFLEKLL
ncbi:MAG: trehalose-phosphatase [Waddliaceae bacterium]